MNTPTIRHSFRPWRRTVWVAAAVLVVSFVVTIYVWRRAESLRKRAEDHLAQAGMFQTVVEGLERLPSRNAKQEARLRQFQVKLNYHGEQYMRCNEAVWRPWVFVVDEPAPP